MSITIRPLQVSDYDAWLPLWDGNNLSQRDEAVTRETWARLVSNDSTVNGLCAIENDQMMGLVHYILHPTTGSLKPVCYMQDLYVDPAHRLKGIGRALALAVAETGKNEGWARVYWLAEAENEAAQQLYKNLGVKLDFTLHVLPLTKV